MNLLASIGKLVAWLGGSLAAISAIFYTFGYLITLANLQMLGLDTVVLGFDPDFYVQRGGRFFLYTVRLAGGFILQPVTGLVLVLAIGIIGVRLWSRSENVLIPVQKVYGHVADFIHRHASVVYMVLLLLLLQHLFSTYENATSPLRISGLLFEAAGENASTYSEEAVDVRDALLNDDERTLQLKFLFTTILAAETGLFLFLSWRITRNLPARPILIAPFAVVFAMSIVALPMVYGLIAVPNKYPTVKLSTGESAESRSQAYFLLNSSKDFLVLWDSRQRQVIWQARGKVDRLAIGRECHLPFAGEQSAGETSTSQGACP